jgi:nitroreductase
VDRQADIGAAIEDALRAPSILNTQPWRWRVGDNTVDLHADRDRHLAGVDPVHRALVLSCGAALHHLRVALASRGHGTQIERMPDPEDLGHLATVRIGPGPGDPADTMLAPQIGLRRTDRRRMSGRPVPVALLEELADQVRRNGALPIAVADATTRYQLLAVLTDTAGSHQLAPDAAAELHQWTHRYSAARDGVSATGLLEAGGLYDQPSHPPGPLAADDAAELMVIATVDDGTLDWLCAGEAMSAALLTATAMGLATTPVTQGMEIEDTRYQIQYHVLRVPEYPQLVIRVGWAATGAAELPATPRRDEHWVVRNS